MLTLKKRLFVDSYKLTRNLTKSCLSAGYSPKNAPSYGGKLLKDPEISQILHEWEKDEHNRIQAQIEERKILLKPSKGSYIERTFAKAEDIKHAPTAAKYWELGGKVLGYLDNESSKNSAPVFQIIAQELHLEIPADTTNTLSITHDIPTT